MKQLAIGKHVLVEPPTEDEPVHAIGHHFDCETPC